MRLGLPAPDAHVSRALAQFAPQIVHAANPFSLGLNALLFARRQHLPLVASYHTHIAAYASRYLAGVLERPAWAYMRALHNRASLNLCTSRPVQEELAARDFRRLALWEPGVDADLFHPTRCSQQWRARLTGGHPDATIILSVGRLAREKQLDTLAPALAGLPGCHLSIVGAGPFEPQLRAAFAGLPVTFAGPLYGEDLAAAYGSADIFALPSPTETLGLVALEAMAAGLPVVGARRGGIPFLVDDQRTGLLFDPDDPKGLLLALQALAEDTGMRRCLGAAGRRRAEGWTWARTTAGLRARYAELISGT
jgi:glycosyltransferase involved in cell wall biosynthesis